MSDRFAGRSIHGAPHHARIFAGDPVLTIDGEVDQRADLTVADLAEIERKSIHDLIPDSERSSWPDKNWTGVPLSALVEFAQPTSEANWIQVLGGPMASVLPLADAAQALLCDRDDGEPISLEHGGPYRLIYPKTTYNLCVKWVDRILVTVDEPDRSAERVAVARQRARDAKA